MATVTVTATDDDGETVMDAFVVTVTVAPTADVAPTNPTPIPPQKVVLGTPKTIDISGHFTGARATAPPVSLPRSWPR